MILLHKYIIESMIRINNISYSNNENNNNYNDLKIYFIVFTLAIKILTCIH